MPCHGFPFRLVSWRIITVVYFIAQSSPSENCSTYRTTRIPHLFRKKRTPKTLDLQGFSGFLTSKKWPGNYPHSSSPNAFCIIFVCRRPGGRSESLWSSLFHCLYRLRLSFCYQGDNREAGCCGGWGNSAVILYCKERGVARGSCRGAGRSRFPLPLYLTGRAWFLPRGEDAI